MHGLCGISPAYMRHSRQAPLLPVLADRTALLPYIHASAVPTTALPGVKSHLSIQLPYLRARKYGRNPPFLAPSGQQCAHARPGAGDRRRIALILPGPEIDGNLRSSPPGRRSPQIWGHLSLAGDIARIGGILVSARPHVESDGNPPNTGFPTGQ